MSFFRKLYLSDRFFLAMGVCSFLFFFAYSVHAFIYLAAGLLFLVLIGLVIELVLLFRKQTVTAERRMAGVFSLSDQNRVTLTITNLSNLRLNIKVIDELPVQLNIRDFKVISSLEASGNQVLQYHVTPKVRGEYHFGNVHVFVKTVIGLALKKETIASEKTVAVFPSIIQMGRQELITLNHPSFTKGDNKNRKLGQSYEFDQIKVYVPGDDTRNINWKASSTLNEVMVNCYEDERSQQIYSVIDKSRVMKMPFNGLTLMDHAVNSSLAFSNIVLKKQDKAGLIIFSKNTGSVLKADKGPRHLKKIMYALYKEKYDYSEANYESLYVTIKRTIQNRSLLFLYTNFDSVYAMERNLPALRLINKNHLLVVVFFQNEELQNYSTSAAETVLDMYQITIARKLSLEKNHILRELRRHGIQSIRCTPENLSAATINKYLELKSTGLI